MGFIATEIHQSLYIFRNNRVIIAIWIHVDDGVVVSNSPDTVSSFKDALCAELDIRWLGVVQQIVGLECVIGEVEVTIAQQQLTNNILDAYPRSVLWNDSPLPVLPGGGLMPNAKILYPTPFQSLIGFLAYLVGGSRPDLSFAVNYLAFHSMGPIAEHWELLDHVIGYLLKTCDFGIQLCPGNLSLSLWSDAG
ncbi:hypothetical protein O181_024128 [Austropuccinia psidii MF-1]|uniref:Reverse transcriptase Ty1/copia-type domain-containing protein n=1 Tax=Austropuccinia psidii MF-1 TaxID=1389203 RepID=A0A9Q3CIC6_9BASI|nr:hypothetical protein [Austropuccinia psidii MF-1]